MYLTKIEVLDFGYDSIPSSYRMTHNVKDYLLTYCILFSISGHASYFLQLISQGVAFM